MNLFLKLLNATGLGYLFEPRIDDEQERQDVIDWIDQYLQTVVASAENDIAKEKKGEFSLLEDQHDIDAKTIDAKTIDAQTQSLGYIQYLIKDKTGKRLELSQFSLVSRNSIKMTESYQKLKAFTDANGYLIELKEVNIDEKGEDTLEELDDHLDDFERYFVITISGW